MSIGFDGNANIVELLNEKRRLTFDKLTTVFRKKIREPSNARSEKGKRTKMGSLFDSGVHGGSNELKFVHAVRDHRIIRVFGRRVSLKIGKK